MHNQRQHLHLEKWKMRTRVQVVLRKEPQSTGLRGGILHTYSICEYASSRKVVRLTEKYAVAVGVGVCRHEGTPDVAPPIELRDAITTNLVYRWHKDIENTIRAVLLI